MNISVIAFALLVLPLATFSVAAARKCLPLLRNNSSTEGSTTLFRRGRAVVPATLRASRAVVDAARARWANVRVSHRFVSATGDAGMSTAEYAIGTVAACAFAALLYKVITSSQVFDLLTGVVTRALHVPF